MYKTVGEERFLLWAVCSIQLQVRCYVHVVCPFSLLCYDLNVSLLIDGMVNPEVSLLNESTLMFECERFVVAMEGRSFSN